MQPYLTLSRDNGLRITLIWWPAKGNFAGRVSGEFEVTAWAADDLLAKDRVPVYCESSDLMRQAKKAAEATERRVRAENAGW